MTVPGQDPHRRLLTLLPRNYWLLRAVIDKSLSPLGLSSAQWRPLLLLYESAEPMTQVQIARSLGMESPTLVRLLDRLTDKGWIARRNCPGDRRAYHVELTPSARNLCARIEHTVSRMRGLILQDLSADEIAQTIAVMERLHTRLEGLEAQVHSVEGKQSAMNLADTDPIGPSNRIRGARSRRRRSPTAQIP